MAGPPEDQRPSGLSTGGPKGGVAATLAAAATGELDCSDHDGRCVTGAPQSPQYSLAGSTGLLQVSQLASATTPHLFPVNRLVGFVLPISAGYSPFTVAASADRRRVDSGWRFLLLQRILGSRILRLAAIRVREGADDRPSGAIRCRLSLLVAYHCGVTGVLDNEVGAMPPVTTWLRILGPHIGSGQSYARYCPRARNMCQRPWATGRLPVLPNLRRHHDGGRRSGWGGTTAATRSLRDSPVTSTEYDLPFLPSCRATSDS